MGVWPTFIRDLCMALYFGGEGGTKESIKALRIQKKVIILITGINKYESFRQKFKENRILTRPFSDETTYMLR